jgi:hypothetical protein
MSVEAAVSKGACAFPSVEVFAVLLPQITLVVVNELLFFLFLIHPNLTWNHEVRNCSAQRTSPGIRGDEE